MAFTFAAWMPCKRKHDLSATLKYLKARFKGKPAAFVPYVHVRGKLIATVDSATLAEIKAEIVRLADGILASDLPDDAARIVIELRGPDPAPVIPFPLAVPVDVQEQAREAA